MEQGERCLPHNGCDIRHRRMVRNGRRGILHLLCRHQRNVFWQLSHHGLSHCNSHLPDSQQQRALCQEGDKCRGQAFPANPPFARQGRDMAVALRAHQEGQCRQAKVCHREVQVHYRCLPYGQLQDVASWGFADRRGEERPQEAEAQGTDSHAEARPRYGNPEEYVVLPRYRLMPADALLPEAHLRSDT